MEDRLECEPVSMAGSKNIRAGIDKSGFVRYNKDDDMIVISEGLKLKENQKVRDAARIANIPLWKVADEVGISEPTFMRWMRYPLSVDRERQVMEAIESIKEREKL